MSITATCLEIREHMDRTWQRLPVSRRLPEPLPLAVLVLVQAGRRTDERHEHSTIMAAANDLLSRTPVPIWLEAAPGGGKTSALKWIARSLADAVAAGDETLPLPVYIDLGQVANSLPAKNLPELCALQLARRRPIDYRPFAASDRPKLFLLDGLDLLSTIRPTELLDAALNSERNVYLFSSRIDDVTRAALDEWPQSYRVKLASLNREAREAWLRESVPPEAKYRFDAIVAHNPQVDSLLGVPLLFAMTASACLDEGAAAEFRVDAFPGRTGIFAGFVAYAIRRVQREGRLTGMQARVWEEATPLWHAFCYEAAMNGYLDRVPETEIHRLVGSAAQSIAQHGATRHLEKWATALDAALEAGLVKRENGVLVFLHQQFAEYFSGRHLADELIAAAHQGAFYERFRGTLERHELDPISAHALSVLAQRPATYALVEDAARWLAGFDLIDACDLLSFTGSSLACSLLQLTIQDQGIPPLERLAAVEALARVPHPHAVATLAFVATQMYRDELVLAETAIMALAAIATTASHRALGTIAADSSVDARLRLTAFLRGGDWPRVSAQELAREALLSADESLKKLAGATLAWCGDASDVDRLESASFTKEAKHISARLTSDSPDRLPPPLSLEAYEEFLKFARYGRALQSATSKESHADIRESAVAAGRFRITYLGHKNMQNSEVDNQDILPTLLALTNPRETRKELFQSKLVNLCTRPERFAELIAHPLTQQLPAAVIIDCAKASGRRHLVPPKVVSATPDKLPTLKKLSAEVVVSQYLTMLASEGGRLSLRSAARYSESIGHKWSPETIRNTKIWRTNQKRLADFKAAHAKDRRRRSRKRPSA